MNTNELELFNSSPKYWLFQLFQNILTGLGFSNRVSNIIVFIFGLFALTAIIWILNIAVVRVSSFFSKKKEDVANINIYDILVEKKFFNRLLVLIALIIIFISSSILFAGFSHSWMQFELGLSRSVIIIWSALVIYSLLNSWQKYFILHPKTRQKSLKGYIQLLEIIIGIVAVILILSIVTGRTKSELFVGLGATAAIITLVFKDTILGFVASIQLSFQDMLRPGDWIEMKSKGADGIIVDINLNSVKVQNWDKSVTMIPIYSLVTDSFTNWRGMENGDGRLFQRTFSIDIDTIKTVDKLFLDSISKNSVVGDLYSESLNLCKVSSPSIITNLALYRAYLETYLRHHPDVNEKFWLFVRYRPNISELGIGMEIYAFSRKTQIASFDEVHRTVMEHIIATIPIFDLAFFQNAAGKDLSRLN